MTTEPVTEPASQHPSVADLRIERTGVRAHVLALTERIAADQRLLAEQRNRLQEIDAEICRIWDTPYSAPSSEVRDGPPLPELGTRRPTVADLCSCGKPFPEDGGREGVCECCSGCGSPSYPECTARHCSYWPGPCGDERHRPADPGSDAWQRPPYTGDGEEAQHPSETQEDALRAAFRAGFDYGSDHDGIDHRLDVDEAWDAYYVRGVTRG